jgi:phosphoenolpyruvate synthase/pyruvate phosphate dikinase
MPALFIARQAVRTLTSPVHLSFSLEAEYHLLKIGALIESELKSLPKFEKIKKDYPRIYELLLDHEKRFFWIQNNYYNVHYVNAEEFYNQLIPFFEESKKSALTVSSLVIRKKEELQSLKESKEKLLKKLPLSREAKNIIEVARLFSKWKDIRKAGVYMGMHHFDRFLGEIAKRAGYTKKELTFAVFNEVESILLKKADLHEELRKRQEKCFFALTPKGYLICSGEEADKFFKYLKVEDMRSLVELKGVVASPGYARARVKIIRKTEDMKSFTKGDILVTNQTTPEFVPVMKKAAAIITEQGGITSHAAIISRELKVPCIIGVKNATNAFMNNETIEVDATNGIIRRLR